MSTTASFEQANKVYRNYNRRLRAISDKATAGDNNAPLQLIILLAEQESQLQKLGWAIGGEDGSPKLVPYVEPTEAEKDEFAGLKKRLQAGDLNATRELAQWFDSHI